MTYVISLILTDLQNCKLDIFWPLKPSPKNTRDSSLLGFDLEFCQIGDFSLSLLEFFPSERCWVGRTKIPKQARLALSQIEGRKQTLMEESEEMSHSIDNARLACIIYVIPSTAYIKNWIKFSTTTNWTKIPFKGNELSGYISGCWFA